MTFNLKTFNLKTFRCLANIAASSRMKEESSEIVEGTLVQKIGSENFESLRKTVKYCFEKISEILKNVQNYSGSLI